MSAEEATVEIVVKSAAWAAAAARGAGEGVNRDDGSAAPRAATPIGRFLKALTGN
ncbi:MAG: hypothetical protein IPL91_04975 [Hyphomicrobium sp.]|nr:hypothetical protein [Hyphomicrobium sp.]